MPDDLALAPDGSIYFSDIGDGAVKRVDRNGKVTRVVSGLQEPEGIVFLPDGSILVGEQAKNRVLRYDLYTGSLTTFMQLENRTSQAGLDGLAFDPLTLTVIVPDSPNGTLLRVSQDAKSVQVLAHGLARPTGAAVEPDGSILVAEENGNAIRRIRRDGTSEVLAKAQLPDDVVVDRNRNIYFDSLGEGTVHVINASNGQDNIFWQGLAGPQGLIVDSDGNIIVAESGMHRIVALITR